MEKNDNNLSTISNETFYRKISGGNGVFIDIETTGLKKESCSIYRVAKGMIYLPDQEEDTQITFQELAAPMGYAIEMKPFTMTVGHDDSVKTVENYRSNYLLYIPVTGRDA